MMAENHVAASLGNDAEDVFCSEDEEDLEDVDDSLLYFSGLIHREAQERAAWLCNFEKSVKTWISRSSGDRTASNLLAVHLPRALCLSVNCPFVDVREKIRQLLLELEVSGVGR